MAGEKIAVLGGTGGLGGGLAMRLADAGYHVIVGSRAEEKAVNSAAELRAAKPARHVEGHANPTAAKLADIVILTVPFENQRATLESVLDASAGKIIIDATVCLKPPKVGTVQIPAEGSAGMIAQAIVGTRARLVSAFQNVAADVLQSDEEIDCDVLVTGNDKEACKTVVELIGAIGARGYYAGPIENSVATEGLTSLLIQINRQFKCHAGIRITSTEGH